jgi:hypothetical protein
MADEERGRKMFQDLAKKVREKVAPAGEPLLNRKGLLAVELLARDLGAPDGMPGLQVWRDRPSKFRLTRAPRNAEIAVDWQRDIGALVVTGEKDGGPKKLVRYVFDEAEDRWRRMDGGGELYEDMTLILVEYLYPEGRTG